MCLRAWVFLFSLVTIGVGAVACGARQDAGLPAAPQANVSLGLAGAPDSASTPIKHIVVVIQENRSFDDLFATFPGANGTTTGLAEPMSKSEQTYCAEKGQPVITQESTIPLTQVNLLGKGFKNNFNWWQDLSHNYPVGYLGDCDAGGTGSRTQPSASNPCAMDGFDLSGSGANGSGHPNCTYTYQYVNPTRIRPYWDMAQQYVLTDNAFQTQGSESFTAHQALIAGGTAINTYESIIDDPTYWPWGCDAPPGVVTALINTSGKYLGNKGPFPCLTYATIRDELDSAKIPWKFYAVQVKGGNSGIWSAFDAIKAVRNSKEWGTKVVWPDTKIFTDIQKGTLPAVAWITPDAINSDHPAVNTKQGVPEDLGPSWVASIVNAVGQSKFWNSTAVVVLWDDWGGYYDHVAPPLYDNQGGLGFRFPMIIISPYVQAHVEHTQYETASIVKFIEANWGLQSLGQEDQRATSIGNAFDFNQKPRAFKKIPSDQAPSYFLRQAPSDLPPDTE